MAGIRVLPDALVDQIAAGEVIERPASVVKELVENALDAGAKRIDVEISDGGIRWIAVTDDGEGIPAQEAALAFRRHATSKLDSAERLGRIATLGFRGEALPSIASVARVRLRTNRSVSSAGVEVSGEAGEELRTRPVACPPGTRVEVAELFARVPARRKFLKRPATEASHVVQWLERIALARPGVHLSLARDGRLSLVFPPTGDLRERALAVLPPSVGERMVPLEAGDAKLGLRGLVSRTDLVRSGPGDIHLFVNGRPVRDRLMLFALREAYRDALPPGRHPAAVIHLEVEAGEVDVNVHPAKWEVRFQDPGAVRALVCGAVAHAIGIRSVLPRSAPPRPWTSRAEVAADAGPPPDFALARALLAPEEARTLPGAEGLAPPVAFRGLRYLGQALGTYLVLEGDGTLVLLDQHAAHERVLFEKLRAQALRGGLEPQALLLPVHLELGREGAEVLREHPAPLARAGFDLEVGEGGVAGGVRVALRALPALLAARPALDWASLLEETAAGLRRGPGELRDGIEGALHHVFATAACHAATRKGDRLEPAEVEALLEALDTTLWVPSCPHGRPILALLPEGELERRFLRRGP